MYGLAPYVAGGLAAVLAAEFLSIVQPGTRPALDSSARAKDASFEIIDRAHKGDRLSLVRGSDPKASVMAVEIIGLRDAAIVYRDRDGRVLYRTDPLSNATVVVRDAILPYVTVRDEANARVRTVPVELYRRLPEPPRKPPVPAGCEPPFSPLSAATSGPVGRCFADARPADVEPDRLAALAR